MELIGSCPVQVQDNQSLGDTGKLQHSWLGRVRFKNLDAYQGSIFELLPIVSVDLVDWHSHV